MSRPTSARSLVMVVSLLGFLAPQAADLAAGDSAQEKLSRPPLIPEPPAPAPVQPAGAQTPTGRGAAQPAQKPATAGNAACPAGAGLIGPKLDLPPGGNTFEEAVLLSPCTYKGLEDAKGWMYFKVSIASGQTLKVTARTRDANKGYLSLRLHGPNGGQIGEKYTDGSSTILEMSYKAAATVFAYPAVTGSVRDGAFQISIE